MDGIGDGVVGQTVKVYKGTTASGTPIASGVTNGDGYYFISYKHTGKSATYTLAVDGGGYTTETVMVKANGFVMVDPLEEIP